MFWEENTKTKAKLIFGLNEHFVEIRWIKNIEDFPKFLKYKDRKWKLFSKQNDLEGHFDYILNFSELKTSNSNYDIYMQFLNDLIGQYEVRCECGAIFTSFTKNHMFYCPKYSPEEKL